MKYFLCAIKSLTTPQPQFPSGFQVNNGSKFMAGPRPNG